MFVIGADVAGLAVLAFALVEDAATETMNGINQFLRTNLGWAYLLVTFVLFLLFGRAHSPSGYLTT